MVPYCLMKGKFSVRLVKWQPIFDMRLSLLKLYLGIRFRPLNWRILPLGFIPTCLWFGPIEFTLIAGKYAYWFNARFSFEICTKKLDTVRITFTPFQWCFKTIFSCFGEWRDCFLQVGPFQLWVTQSGHKIQFEDDQ